jgi:hypothetical protein
MNKRIVTLVSLIALLLIASACSGGSSTKDCGEDMDCFVEASRNCDPAKMLFPLEFEMMGINITTTTYQEIIGMEDGLCVFKMRTEDVSVEFSDEAVQSMLDMGLTQEQVDEQIQMSKDQASEQGLNQICRVEPETLAAAMEQADEMSFALDDWDDMNCEDVVENE